MYTLQKMAMKLGPKLIANPALAVEVAPFILLAAGAALVYDALK